MPHHRHDPGTSDPNNTVVRLEREFDATPDELWQMLTDPAELTKWLCAGVELEARPGGAITLKFDNSHTTIRGHVVRIEAPRLLEYTWRRGDELESVVRFELHPAPARSGTRLSVTHTNCHRPEIGEMAAGWHHHLELLATQLAGQPVTWDWARFTELHTHYSAAVP